MGRYIDCDLSTNCASTLLYNTLEDAGVDSALARGTYDSTRNVVLSSSNCSRIYKHNCEETPEMCQIAGAVMRIATRAWSPTRRC